MTLFSIRIIIVLSIREKFARPEFANVVQETPDRYAPLTAFYKYEIFVNEHVSYAIYII
jgi:hypothetical protein